MLDKVVRGVFPENVHLNTDLKKEREAWRSEGKLSVHREHHVLRPCGKSVPGVFDCKIAHEAGMEGERERASGWR